MRCLSVSLSHDLQWPCRVAIGLVSIFVVAALRCHVPRSCVEGKVMYVRKDNCVAGRRRRRRRRRGGAGDASGGQGFAYPAVSAAGDVVEGLAFKSRAAECVRGVRECLHFTFFFLLHGNGSDWRWGLPAMDTASRGKKSTDTTTEYFSLFLSPTRVFFMDKKATEILSYTFVLLTAVWSYKAL